VSEFDPPFVSEALGLVNKIELRVIFERKNVNVKTLGQVARNTVDGDSALRVVIETNRGTRLCGMGFPNNETECCLPGRIYPGDRAKRIAYTTCW
jgi:hypothetical protein